MKCKTQNPIIEAALRSIQDALPVIEHEAGKEELRHKQHWGERCDLFEENAEHVKFIDRLEAKIDRMEHKAADLGRELWLCEQKVEKFDVLWFAELEEKAERLKFTERLEAKNDELVKELWIQEEQTQETLTDFADWERENVALRKTCKELESNLRTEKIKTKHYGERLKEFTIIVDETDAYWRKKDLRNKAYIEYLNALLANNEDSIRHAEALEENAARDGREQLASDLEPYIRINERFRVNEQS